MNTSYLKRKADQYEVYKVTSRELNAELTNGKTDFASEGVTEGIAVTVVKDKRIGFAFTNDPRKFKNTADKAIMAALANNKDPDFKGLVGKQRIKKIKNYDSKLKEASLKDFDKLRKQMLKGILKVNKNIKLSTAAYSRSVETTEVINSEGVDLRETTALNTLSYDLTMKHGSDIIATFGAKGDVKPLNAESIKEDARRLLTLRGKKAVKTMNCQAILHPEVLAELLSQTLIPNASASSVQQGRSLLIGKLNKKIISDKITITDDATTKGLIATGSFDCEGTPSQRNKLIDRGVLKTYLYNNYTARKDGKKSTGNAARTVASLPSIGANNIIMEPGKDKDITGTVKSGVYVREILGVRTMNALTGDFSLGILEGHYIENGKPKHPIKNAMIAGNLYDMLNNVVSLGAKTQHAFAGHGAFYLPETSFPKIKIIGKN